MGESISRHSTPFSGPLIGLAPRPFQLVDSLGLSALCASYVAALAVVAAGRDPPLFRALAEVVVVEHEHRQGR